MGRSTPQEASVFFLFILLLLLLWASFSQHLQKRGQQGERTHDCSSEQRKEELQRSRDAVDRESCGLFGFLIHSACILGISAPLCNRPSIYPFPETPK